MRLTTQTLIAGLALAFAACSSSEAESNTGGVSPSDPVGAGATADLPTTAPGGDGTTPSAGTPSDPGIGQPATPSTGGSNSGSPGGVGGGDAAGGQSSGEPSAGGQNSGGSNSAGGSTTGGGTAGSSAAGGSAAGGSAAGGSAAGGTSAGGASTGGAGGAAEPTDPRDPECLAMVDAANAFLASLDDGLTAQAGFAWDSGEKTSFEFLPPGNAAREGLSLKLLNADQRNAFNTFLQSALSMPGYMKADAIMQMELVLRQNEGADPDYRDPDNYFISIFGEPNAGEEEPWGWRFEGHHLSLHTSVMACQQYSTTPAFWGISGYSNESQNPLSQEADLAEALFEALDAAQQDIASDGNDDDNAVSTKNQLVDPYQNAGLAAGDMSAAHQDQLRQLIGAYVGNIPPSLAGKRLQAIEAAGFDDIRFLYHNNGFYRIQGPTFIIEHVPAGNNHVHAVWRDFAGDWGEDLLERHIALEHTNNPQELKQ